MLHKRTHPEPVDGCFGCKLLGIHISSEATPSRSSSRTANEVIEREKRWDRDMKAYKNLRRDGLQPQRIDGSAEIERKAKEEWQVTTGILPDK